MVASVLQLHKMQSADDVTLTRPRVPEQKRERARWD